jgi:predicted N-acyltransferase
MPNQLAELVMPLTPLGSIHDLPASQWNSLLNEAQPFLQHAFLSALEDSGSVGGRTGWQPSHAVLFGEQGQLLAAMPGYVKSHSYGEYVFDHGWADACHRAGIDYYPKLAIAR